MASSTSSSGLNKVARTFLDLHVPAAAAGASGDKKQQQHQQDDDAGAGGEIKGRVVFELWMDKAPRAAENFRALCTGERGISRLSHVPLSYRSSTIHRLVPGFLVQGGDFAKRDGTGMESIYGASGFADDPHGLEVPLDRDGLLVCAKKGETVKDSNGGQWFVTLAPEGAPHLPEGTHVVFGRVVKGFEVLKALEEQVETDDEWRPLRQVSVVGCGELVRVAKKAAAEPAKPSPEPAADARRSRSPRRRARSRSGTASHSESDASSRSRSRSASVSSASSSEDDRRRRRRHRHKHESHRGEKSKKSRSKRDRGDNADRKEPKEETLEELDARLEREEKERLEKARLEKLAEMKRALEKEREQVKAAGGVVYKGRGAMKYVDPERPSSGRAGYASRTAMDAVSPYGGDYRRRQEPGRPMPKRRDDELGRGGYRGANRDARDGGVDGDWRAARRSTASAPGRGDAPRFVGERDGDRRRGRSQSPLAASCARSPSLSPAPRERSLTPRRGEQARSESPMQMDD